jgi:large subunit ribosomal protein L31
VKLAKIISSFFWKTNNYSYFCTPKNRKIMKEGIHPSNYRFVIFKDMTSEHSFLTRSCVETKETAKWEDGNEYPLYKLDISDKSHPFFTGKQTLVDTAGRIDKFRQRYTRK